MTLPFIILTKTFNYGSIKLKPWLKDEYKCSITFMMHMFTWHASFGLCGCLETGGNSVKYWLSWLCILFRIVLAPYSSLGEASQHGTKLWASTWNTEHWFLMNTDGFYVQCFLLQQSLWWGASCFSTKLHWIKCLIANIF